MYHYVRPAADGMPYFRYLGLDDFRRQLDHFETTHGFVERAAFLDSLRTGRAPRGVVLTFDDGFKDHHAFVMPALLERGLWGIFYVAVGQYMTGKMLDVHRIHMLVGSHGGLEVAEAVRDVVADDMLVPEHRQAFRGKVYLRQDNDAATDFVKTCLNYFISYAHRERVLDQLMARFFGPDQAALIRDFYLSTEDIADLKAHGMIVGSHSCSHPVMSKLDVESQRRELAQSFDFLERATGGLGVRTFCYPYGGFHSFTADTERLLTELGSEFSFNVEQRDVAERDLLHRPQALPRYDCNQFPHGKARMG
jgi:peptidoglycan/xylan/chitin deacetylase (PgdA/CDA1 family)